MNTARSIRPLNTVDAAVSVGKLIAQAVSHAGPNRPVFDSEHGPIHTFKDHHKTLAEPFDDEYFRHIQWAHLASGGAGGGMRWPNRTPHSLTLGMRKAQNMLAAFLPLIDWAHFRRVNLSDRIRITGPAHVFACGGDSQAIVYLLRHDCIARNGMLDPRANPITCELRIPDLRPGSYRVHAFDPVSRGSLEHHSVAHFSAGDHLLVTTPSFGGEIVLAITRGSESGHP